MTNESKKKEFKPMLTETREYFLTHFANNNGGIDSELAANYFGVAPRTIRHWWRVGCPNWVNKFARVASRSIPDNKEWDGFGFYRGKLFTPYKRHEFSAADLLKVFFDRQFNRFDKAANRQLTNQVDALRNEDEANAINGEIDDIINTLSKLKDSPILARKRIFHKSVKRDALKRSD
jgi:hypothetical protein